VHQVGNQYIVNFICHY